jgi:AraC family transcriptional regulator
MFAFNPSQTIGWPLPASHQPFSSHPPRSGSEAAERSPINPRDWSGVRCEREWRAPPTIAAEQRPQRITVARWRDENSGTRQHGRAADPRFAVVAIALRPTSARLLVDGRCVHDGKVPAGLTITTDPGATVEAEFSGACDMLHLFIPTRRLSAIIEELGVAEVPCGSGRDRAFLSIDPIVERLAWLLLRSRDQDSGSSELYLDGIGGAIVTRILNTRLKNDHASRRQGLVRWRLRRVQELIESQLSEPLSLRDLAKCAGLSRMHFAAQFRAATGLRPHEYLVRRRIQRAQEMLLTTGMPLVEVALSVGFQTQAHFTTVFRQLLGETPGRWRQEQRLG